MLALGRRRTGALSTLTICLTCVFFFFASTARAAVLGIDFGTLNIKAAIVKPGIPLDIVLTKDSKRKETAAVAFKPHRDAKNNIITETGLYPERAYGGDALALQGRFPSEVYPNLKLLLGLPSNSEGEKTVAIYKDRYPAVQLQQDKELGTAVFKSQSFSNDVSPFSVEELIGMELANIKRNAENMAGKGSVVDDAVITIPAFYTADERRAIVKAANFAGLQVMSLISDGLAVGLDYAKSRTFPEVTKDGKPEYHLVYDMGAGSTTATVLRFQGRSVKDVGRYNKTVQEVAVLGAGWERSLGGDALTHIIVDDFVKKLLTKPALKSRGTTIEEIKSNGRLMSRFFKDAERARQVLSANSETSVSFEEILPDIDFRTKITRTEFEELTAEYADRVSNPITEALKMAKLEMADISSVILHGGAIRTPFVQSKLEAAVDDKAKLRSSVNPDESAVFGAAFKAASMSASFKVKEIRASDVASYSAGLLYLDNGKQRKQILFSPSSPVGAGATTKQVTFKDKEEFSFGFVQNVDGVDRSILQVQSDNLTSSVAELSRQAGCDKDSISTKFSIRLGPAYGLPEVTSGSVSCEVDESKGSVGDSVKGWLGFGKKKDQEPLEGEGDGPVEQVEVTTPGSTASSSSSATSSGAKTAETPKKSVETIQLRWSTGPAPDTPQPASEKVSAMVQRLAEFDQSDKARYARDEAQNVLESYTYFVRDFLENKDYESVGTKEERDIISKTLAVTKEWMESGDLLKATQEALQGKYKGLQSLIEPIQKRRTEGTRRPEMVKNLQKTLDELNKAVLRIESESAKAASSLAKAASSSASSIASAVTAEPDEDDLDEPDTSSSAAKSSKTAAVNPYDSIDLSFVKETANEISGWLTEKLAEQTKLKPYEDPVLLTKDLERRAGDISRSLADLVRKASTAASKASSTSSTKKPKPTKKPSKKDKASSADAEEPAPAEEPAAAVPLEDTEAADPEAAQNPGDDGQAPAADETAAEGGQKVKGSESLDDLKKFLNDEHDEL